MHIYTLEARKYMGINDEIILILHLAQCANMIKEFLPKGNKCLLLTGW